MAALSLIKTCLPFIHQCIQWALDLCEIPIRHPGIELYGLWAYLPDQHLNISRQSRVQADVSQRSAAAYVSISAC